MHVHTAPHWKALRFGKDNSRWQSFGSTLNIHQDVLKSGNLLHKRAFVDSQFGTTVYRNKAVAKSEGNETARQVLAEQFRTLE